MQTNLLGRAVSFHSFIRPMATPPSRPFYGTIVGVMQVEASDYLFENKRLPTRTIFLVELASLDKGRVVEVPMECAILHSTLEQAEQHIV